MMSLRPYWSCLRQTLTRSATPVFLANTRWNHISSLGYSSILRAVKQNSCLFIRTRVSLYVSSFSSSTIRLIRTGKAEKEHTRSVLTYIVASAVFMIGATYAGVPLYRMLCQSTGLGGEVQKGHDSSKVENMTPVQNRVIKIRFNADTASSMQWNFRPHQTEIKVHAGETALAFYKAKNPTDRPVIGISTYNVVPFEAGPYFNKIQCFCFEEQRLNPHEEVDLPVFFYIDPEFCDDPRLQNIDIITLSYTFFEAKEGMTLPLPGFMNAGRI